MAQRKQEDRIDIIEALEREVSEEERRVGAPLLPARRGLKAARKRLERFDQTAGLTASEGQDKD